MCFSIAQPGHIAALKRRGEYSGTSFQRWSLNATGPLRCGREGQSACRDAASAATDRNLNCADGVTLPLRSSAIWRTPSRCPRRVGHDAVGRGEDLQAAHVGVVGGEQHADVAGDAGHDDAADLQVVEQRVERGGEEAGVLRLEDEVVMLRRAQPPRHPPAGRALPRGSGTRPPEVGSPLAEVVVDVDDRDGGRRGARLSAARRVAIGWACSSRRRPQGTQGR